MAESFLATLQIELLDNKTWDTPRELTQAIFEWIEAFYNPKGDTHPSNMTHQPTTNTATPPHRPWHDHQTKPVRETGGRSVAADSLFSGSPAHAGIDPMGDRKPICRTRFPRTRGDRPSTIEIINRLIEVPPHTRG